MTQCLIPGAVALKLSQDDHRGKEQSLGKDKRSLKVCANGEVFSLNLEAPWTGSNFELFFVLVFSQQLCLCFKHCSTTVATPAI